jgi:antitoxin component YwqK of YwqJK toxin-antitoxin module
MKYLILITLTVSLSLTAAAQQLTLIYDSIMNAHMRSGLAGKEFIPKGRHDKQERRQGKWKDYETIHDGSYQVSKGSPLKTMGIYLFYGEGEFTDDKRTGDWRIYVIEDKSFRKILSQTLTYQAGVPNGPFKYYYPDGKTAQEGTYQEGEIDGSSQLLYPDGKVFGKQTFVAGQKQGRQEYFYPSGKLSFIIEYDKGLRQGAYESYYPDGKMQEVFRNEADSIDGVYRYYYPSGQLWTETVYKRGKTMNIIGSYDKNGKERDKGTLKDGNGYINYYTEEGKLYTVITFKDGVKIKEEDR